MDIEFNKVFGFFLKHKGVLKSKFKKTDYGYRTYDNKWKLFERTSSISFMKPIRVYNGCDYDDEIEETRFQIIKSLEKISIEFLYTKII